MEAGKGAAEVTATDECLLSILIPTLDSRQSLCDRLCSNLDLQIGHANATQTVEVLTLRDTGLMSVGAKRNQLIGMARGRFVVFVDDDDAVSEDYVEQLVTLLRTHPDVDCISFAGEINFRGKYPRKLVHSIKYTDWYHSQGQYLRPPCHITPMRKEIVERYAFAEVDYAEDMDWALRISQDQALKKELILDQVFYFYNCRRYYALQWLLDRSQPLRHALGLRFVRSLGLRQKLRAVIRRSKS